jgi:signal transduction histidine kinase
MSPASVIKFSRKPRLRIVAVFVCFVLVVASVLTGYFRIQAYNRKELESTLSAILATTRRALAIWKDAKIADAVRLADEETIRSSIIRLLALNAEKRGARSPALLDELSRDVAARSNVIGFVVVAPSGEAIAAKDKEAIGRTNLQKLTPDAIHRALAGIPAISQPVRTGLPLTESDQSVLRPFSIIVAAPVHDEAGQVIAALCLRFDPSREFTQITELSRWQNSGETYLFDRNGTMLTESRFVEQMENIGLLSPADNQIIDIRDPGGNLLEGYHPAKPRQEQPLTRMAQNATQGLSGMDLDGYRDYRGATVIGAWIWDGELGLGMTTEIDTAEAYRRFFTMRGVIALILCTVLAGSVVVAWLLGSDAQQREALLRREELLARVAHDLRNPLNSMGLSVAALKQCARSRDVSSYENKALQCASGAIDRMKSLISDLMSAAKIESGSFTLSLTPQDLSAIIERARIILEPLAAQKSIHLKVEIPAALPHVLADDGRVIEILSNLVGNSLKFTPEDGRITIRSENQSGYVRICVADTGCGIPSGDIKRIFQRNWQSASSNGHGLGLGLYIVKGLVEAHGGKIWAESDLGQGTQVYFTLKSVAGVSSGGELPVNTAR